MLLTSLRHSNRISQLASHLAARRTMSSGTYRTTHLQAIHWGPGSVKTQLLPAISSLVPSKDTKALILTGNSLANKTPIINDIRSLLEKEGRYAATFHDIGEHAPVEGIRKAQSLMQDNGAGIIIAVGGGSPIDAAKAISYYIHQSSDKTKDSSDERGYIPIIAIPTTLSVAETTQNAGFTENGKKTGVSDVALVPRVLILDAELTTATPERLWLSSGMRAVDHALELLYRPDPSPLLYPQYLGAARELFTLLPLSKQHPDDIGVRQRLQLAAIASLWPESRKGALGFSHALGHALGSTYKIPHGITSCLTLAGSIALVAESKQSTDEQILALASALEYLPASFRPQGSGESIGDSRPVSVLLAQSNASSLPSEIEKARKRGIAVSQAVETLVEHLGLKSSLSEYNVPREHVGKIAQAVAGAMGGEKGKEEREKALREVLERVY